MSIIKCKMCGGDLNLQEGKSVCECEYCGSRQTVPAADNEKKLQQFQRADWLRRNCEFDRAAAVYESIVAEFREESEAYWGLVLCKYGIEYVDDPGTGKKIPTCHRSSFESVMEDPSLEMAMDYADAVARRVYREEAKQIEELRKGIIAVSANEQPYDIFICYKETDEKGDRTLDSVLAQDIYDALTDKGYRVFFARISLEDKLGVEYEPYIFAALNSAKVMLAVGTDYEYFNAVWVKNEWSRFLKLMAQDKSKYLIPCFKGLDAYDMPKEFAKLQAQDLGKVGAMQDLLRGIEKILPREKNTNVVQQMVVDGAVGNKIAAALERGNMALEDGEWAKADSFFEDVLSNDARNAQAYLGKALAWEKCRSLDALVRYRRDIPRKIESSTAYIPENKDHIRKMAKTYVVPGLLGENAICKEYEYDLSYPTEVPSCRAWYEKENDYWSDHKLLNRAEQFADEALAESLKNAKQQATADLLKRLRTAEAEERVRKTRHQEEYDAFLASRDKTVSGLHREKVSIREKIYESCLHDVKESLDVERLEKARSNFRKFGDYKDSAAMAEYCAGRIEEIKAAWKKAEKEVREQEERIDEHNHKLHKTLRWIEAILFLVGIAVMGCAGTYLSERLELMGSAATLQAVLGLIPIGCTRLSIKLYEEDTTGVRFIRLVARVTTLLGIVGYGILAISMSDAEGSDFYLSIWGAIMCLKNLIAFIFPFYVKKLET